MPLSYNPWQNPPLYIAVCKHGYGMSHCPAKAIRRCQEHVPLESKPSQLLIYSAPCEWEDEEENFQPVGFKGGSPVWRNGSRPKLAGLTNTHAGFIRRKRWAR